MSKEAIAHYEAALKEAFPRGATGDVFHHWNEARKAQRQWIELTDDEIIQQELKQSEVYKPSNFDCPRCGHCCQYKP